MARPEILPVIHHYSVDLTKDQARLAMDAGADGVFLISHDGNPETDRLLGSLCLQLKTEFGLRKVGLNLLTMDIMEAAQIALASNADMLWGDECGVSSAGLTDEGRELQQFAARNRQIKVFASVAFKGQTFHESTESARLAAKLALKAGFISTTSGRRTGEAPTVEKIRGMFVAANGTLAVASGMTPENIHEYAPYLSHVLVATGVSLDGDFHRLDPARLRALIANAAH